MHLLLLALLVSAIAALPSTSRLRFSRTKQQIAHKPLSNSTIPSRACGVAPPTDALIAAHNEHRRSLRTRASPDTQKYMIDTAFHIVTTDDMQGSVTHAMIANQFGGLQAAYATSNISFRLISVDYSVNNSWATDENDADMKVALRVGNYSTLNIYFQSNLSTSMYGSSSQLLGYCTLPTNITYIPCTGCGPVEYPNSSYAGDGCNVHAGSMPDGPLEYYNQGKTAVHEVGHWFGLLHTFQDNSCDPSDPGDYIADTPQESVSTDGCPVGKKSCPDCPGFDPIHNFMDYSSDACYEAFTPGQIDRMQNLFGSMRLGY